MFFFPLKLNRVSIAGQMRVIAGSADSTGPWRRAGRRSMAIWQWLTRGLITTLTTITPPSFCTTQRYSRGHSCEMGAADLFSKKVLLEIRNQTLQGFTCSSSSFINITHGLKTSTMLLQHFCPLKCHFYLLFFCNRRHVNSGT